jgi:hypothetical protein
VEGAGRLVDAGLHPNDCSKSGYSVLAITRGANIRKGSAAKNRAEALEGHDTAADLRYVSSIVQIIVQIQVKQAKRTTCCSEHELLVHLIEADKYASPEEDRNMQPSRHPCMMTRGVGLSGTREIQ